MPHSMQSYPHAKLNLGLHITARRPDGYHNLETIFYPIPLCDELEVTPRTGDIPAASCSTDTIHTADYSLRLCGTPIEGEPESNLIIRAYRLLKDEFHLPPLSITLRKVIPSGAGLGGGSADAAFMIRMLNEQFELNLSTEEMERRVGTLGADCAFFIKGAPTFATGIGNEFSPVQCSLAGWHLVLVKPDTFISTREAYAGVKPHAAAEHLPDLVRLPIEEWRGRMVNDFEASIFPAHPEVAAVKERLYELGASYASMSGSGAAVFGLFRQAVPEAQDAFASMFCHCCKLA